MKKTTSGFISALIWLLAPVLSWAAVWHEAGDVPPAVMRGLVQVEAVVGTDEGDEPRAAGWRTRCPNCGKYHVSDVDDALRDRRPVVVPGFLVSADQVVLADPMIESRFVREWRVRFGDAIVRAKVAALATDRGALRLMLEKPLATAEPLQFTPDASGPFFVLSHTGGDDGFGAQLQPLGSAWVTKADGRRFLPVPATALVLSADGRPITLTLREELPPRETWKTPPADWPWLSAEDYEKKLSEIVQTSAAGLLRATLWFRSPKLEPGSENSPDAMEAMEAGPNTTAVAAVLTPQRLLVLAGLLPRQTARLEKVLLALPDGREMTARFVATVTELGAFVIEPEEPLTGVLPRSPEDWAMQRGRPVFSLQLLAQGEQRIARAGHIRLAGLGQGLNGREVPNFPGEVENRFFFDIEGRLLGLPIGGRPAAATDRWQSRMPVFALHASELARFAGDAAAFSDVRNTPQSENAERQLAWLGVELQPLDRELARVHGVLAQMEKGSGALVIHVFPGSPAERAGIEVGDVLLRVQLTGAPKPVSLQVQPGRFAFQPFPWDQYDELPEPYYDQIPPPWASAENEVTRLLKDFGVGSEYRLDLSRKGQGQSVQLVVETGPSHYGTAPQAENEGLGLTLRELTFETRRFFQMAEGDAGMVVSRVVAGSRASVAGVKPYEIIVAVNNQPVRTVADFTEGVNAGGELSLAVRRMHQSRVVSITLATP